MPSALATSIRQQIIEQTYKGFSLLSIAQSLHLSYSTVRRIYKQYNTLGIGGLATGYNHCGRSSGFPDRLIYRAAVYLKGHHPGWGAAFIRLALQQRYSHATPPTERTLQRWFKARGLGRAKSSLCVPQPIWARQIHDVWQIDAKEQLVLARGQRACYLTIVDEKSGCLLTAMVFPPLPYQ